MQCCWHSCTQGAAASPNSILRGIDEVHNHVAEAEDASLVCIHVELGMV